VFLVLRSVKKSTTGCKLHHRNWDFPFISWAANRSIVCCSSISQLWMTEKGCLNWLTCS
jgi:hypothetical protein